MKKNIIICIFSTIAFVAACNLKKAKKIVTKDTTITNLNAYNNLFLDSIYLTTFINNNEEYKPFEDLFINFYVARNYEYAWFDSVELTPHASSLVNLFETTANDLADSNYFSKSYLLIKDSLLVKKRKLTPIQRLNEELVLTGQFFIYAKKMYLGSNIDIADLGWLIPRKKIDLKELLASTLQLDSVNNNQLNLQNKEYKKLQSAIAFYHNLAKNNKWDSLVLQNKFIKIGDSLLLLIAIKQRLFLLGDASNIDTTKFFDSSLLPSIKKFQQRMGLTEDGVIGKKFMEELNITPAKRLQQLLLNLERVRWLPSQKTDNYIIVNIPEYKLHVYENNQPKFDMNIIVGSASNNTVIFSGNLQTIVFSPYWNIPSSIVEKEILPAIKRNSNYLNNKNMEITGYNNGLPLIRQKPGLTNSLGLVKFLFPNSHSIYFHDTPNKNLFQETSRSFSHGCIRLQEPKKFAQYLLRNDTATIWKSNKIDSVMHLTKEKWVTLKNPIPVSLVYFTAWVNENNQLNFRKDIYKHDEKLATKLFKQ